MLEKNIILYAPFEIPDERELFEMLVEELNPALETGGLRIGRIDWVYGTDETDCFHLSGDEETRMVQFILQLQVSLNALYRDMLSVDKSSSLTVFEKPILSLRRLPFVRNTPDYRKIMEKVRQAEEKDYSMDVLLEEFFRSEGKEKSDGENTSESHKRKQVMRELKALPEVEIPLLKAALAVVRVSRPSASPRWHKAEELFWNGDYEAALTHLELPKIKTELRKAARENDLTTVENRIGEAMLRIRLLQIKKLDWSQRKAQEREIVSIYKTCITCGRNILPKTTLAGLMTEYADFLDHIGQDRRSWIAYERVIPMWRALTEEVPLTSLPELAIALGNYSHLLFCSYMFATTDPNGEICYDDVYRNRTAEVLLKEVVDIYRLLTEENTDAALPLLADATYQYGGRLLHLHYAQRAMQTFSDAVDLYRLLAERHPECYKSLLDEICEDITKQIQIYSKYYEDEDKLEDVQDLRSRADHDHPDAQFQLGKVYQIGDGVLRDNDEAEKWYTRAAENGYLEAQRCMGFCCLDATLGRRDMKAAEKWFRMAAMQGDEESQLELAKICMKRNDKQDQEEALYWLNEAAGREESGEACYLLGQCHEFALGVPKSYEQAAFWYLKGSDDFSNMDCFYRLGHLYQYGKGVPQDYNKALHCYEEVRSWGFEYPDVKKKIDKLLEKMDDQ